MNIRLNTAGFILSILLSFMLAGCFSTDRQSVQTASFSESDSPADWYQQAASNVKAAESITMRLKSKTVISAGGLFTEESSQILAYKGYGSEDMSVTMDQTLSFGTTEVTSRELYSDGMGYFTVNGNKFMGPMTADDCIARYTPVSLLEPSLYNSIESTITDGYTRIGFSQATAAESWAIPDGAQLIEACGLAVLDSNGKLTYCRYDITYSHGSASVTQSVTAFIDTDTEINVVIPSETAGYVGLNVPAVPLLLEQACGYLLQADHVKATVAESIVCQAFGISRNENTQMTVSGKGSHLNVQLDTTVVQADQSHGSNTATITQSERFQDGVYTVTTDGSDPVANDSVTDDSMQTYCQDILVGSIMLPAHITAATTTVTDTSILLHFTGAETLAEAMCANACQVLYSDASLLNNLASAYTTETMTCYLEIDKYTGLPVASGISYSGIHTIEGFDYQLTSTIDQVYSFTE